MRTDAARLAGCIRIAVTATLLASITMSADARVVTVGGRDYPTLASALASVPRLSANLSPGESLELVLPSGVMRLREAVIVGKAASGTLRAPLIIRGARDGSTVLSGAVPIPMRAARVDDVPGISLPMGTVALDLSGSSSLPSLDRRGPHSPSVFNGVQLFQGRHWLQSARWPSVGYATAAASGTNEAGPRITVPVNQLEQWRREPALWAAGYWGNDWEYERVPVTAVTGSLQLASLRAEQSVRADVRFRVENAVSALREGSVVLLPQKRLALVLPEPGAFHFEATTASTLVRIEGAANVVFRDIALERSSGDALIINDAANVIVANCHVRDAGGNGIVVSGGEQVTIRDTIVSRIGERGVVLGGGDRDTLRPAGHRFVNGLISDFGRLSPSYRPGIDLWGVGSAVMGSVITGGDHAALVLSGNDHQIIDNEIRDVLRDTDDAGAIYSGRDWTMRGFLIKGNFIHKINTNSSRSNFLSGVYLDDQISGENVEGNIIKGGDYAVVIGGGRDNMIARNVLVDQRRGGIHIDTRGIDTQKTMIETFRRRLAAVPVVSPVWRSHYPKLAMLTPAQQGVPAGNVVRENVMVGKALPMLVGTPEARRWIVTQDNRHCTHSDACTPSEKIERRRVPELQRKLAAWLK